MSTETDRPLKPLELPCAIRPELFFSDDPIDIEQAKGICLNLCFAREVQTCRERGFEDANGVYGGLSAEDRKQLAPSRMARAQRDADRESKRLDKVARVFVIVRLLNQGCTIEETAKRARCGKDAVYAAAPQATVFPGKKAI